VSAESDYANAAMRILTAQGQSAAETRREQARIAAAQRIQTGNLWSHTIADLGQLPLQFQQLQQNRAEQQVRQQQLALQTRQAERLEKAAAREDQDASNQQAFNNAIVLGPDGRPDWVTTERNVAGIPGAAPALLKFKQVALGYENTLLENKERHDKALARVADGLMEAPAAMRPKLLLGVLPTAVSEGHLSQAQADQMRQMVQPDPNGPPDVEVATALIGQMGGTQKAVKLTPVKTVNEQGVAGTRMVPEDQPGFYPEPPKEDTVNPTEWSVLMQAAGGNPTEALKLWKRQHPAQSSGGGAGGGGSTVAIPDKYKLLLGRATLNLPAVRRENLNATASMAFAQGGESALKDVVRQTAIETENVDTKNQVMGRMAMTASLKDALAILTEMEAKGVPTNILSGTAEDIARKLGTSTNPEYVEMANRLTGTLINYRRNATGANFGEAEGRTYEKMFPNYKNTFPVNKALIKGLLREAATYDRVYWQSKFGKDGADLLGLSGESTDGGGGGAWKELGGGLKVRKKAE
jgi:hypothetical protein